VTAPVPLPGSGTQGAQASRSEAYLDAHVHFWDPERLNYPWLSQVPFLNRPHLPADLVAQGARPEGVIAVEADRLTAQALTEADWLGGVGREDLPVARVVGHVPLERGQGCAGELERLAALPAVGGVRRLLQDEPAGAALRPEFVAGVRLLATVGLPMDLCVRHYQLPEVTELARRVPEVTFVLDHLGKPEISVAAFADWASNLERLAGLPNVRCKLSGLATEADADHRAPEDLLPFLGHAVAAFGPERCMFASDWPVVTLAMAYGQWLDLVREAVHDLDVVQRDLVLRGTARRVYGGLPSEHG
jgi:L-fuconolactonase